MSGPASIDAALGGFLSPIMVHKVGLTMEAAGQWHSYWYTKGVPGGDASAPSPGLAGAALSGAQNGSIPYANPTGGKKTYLGRIALYGTTGLVWIFDRLWQNSGIASTTTTPQTINSVTFAARDDDGSSNGKGVFVGLEVSTATTNGAAITNTTLSYTNSTATGGTRTATIQGIGGLGFPATAQVGTFCPFSLQAGDVGVRSISSLTLGTSYGTGVVHLVAYRLIGGPFGVTTSAPPYDVFGTGAPEWQNDSVPWFVINPTTTTGETLDGSLSLIQA